MPITINDLSELEALLEQHPEWQERLAVKILNERTLRCALQAHPELKEALRREILDEEFLKLPAIVRELVEAVQGLAQRVERVEQSVEGLRAEVKELNDWRRGETARREGEQYERKIIARAPRIFGTGTGGSPERDMAVRDQVMQWLAQADLLDEDDELSDPLNADLVWWKASGQVAVAEISIKVNGEDVQRALQRAQTLRKAGLEATAVVVGSEWAHPEAKEQAEQAGVEWRIGKDYSDGLRAFRKAS